MPDQKEGDPPIGEAVKATQNGLLPIGTVDQILNAPSDIVEEVLEIPEWGYSVKVRSFTSAQSARIRKSMYITKPDGSVETDWPTYDIARFDEGVIEPEFGRSQVRALHMKSGSGFQKVLAWLNEKSGVGADEVREAEDAFPGEQERDQD